jgi:DNA polymerase I
MQKRLLIIDQLNLFFRSYIVNPALSSNGQPIGGLVGVVKSLQKICRETKPDKIVICWDGEGGSKKRKLMKKDYKAGRKPIRLNRDIRNLSEPEERTNKIWQMQRVVEYYNCMPLIQLIFNGIEADDIIAQIVYMPEYKDWQKVIVSSDKDFFQLLGENTVLYRPIQKQILNKNNILEQFKIHPNNFALARAMAGDRSDNLEGIGGVGLKTISKRFPFLVQEDSKTISDIVDYSKAQLQESNLKVYQSVLSKKEILERNYQMMQLYVPSLNITAKKLMREIMKDADISFNKTEIIKMMTKDGFADLEWTELQAFFRRIVLDN